MWNEIMEYLRMMRTWLPREVTPMMLLGITVIGTEMVKITIWSISCIFTKFLFIKREKFVTTVTNVPNTTYDTHDN